MRGIDPCPAASPLHQPTTVSKNRPDPSSKPPIRHQALSLTPFPTPSDDQREPIRTVISKATPPSEIVPDTFFPATFFHGRCDKNKFVWDHKLLLRAIDPETDYDFIANSIK